ncbi:MAG: carbamoyl phosphate synthase small subunit [Clostridia bacterium]|nr:carbamoyl phosphate synthase small subunit [Clostridia bacterium]
MEIVMQIKAAELILENGMRFKGNTFGYVHEAVGEVVFSTAMTGYQEGITDPACCGQILVLTYPLIGNYGINLEDMEADKPALTALVVREKCDYPNNFRTEMDLDGFLRHNKVLGLEGIDTRALARTIRDHGSMRGIITTESLSDEEAMAKIEALDNSDVVSRVSTKKTYTIDGDGKHIAFIDLGTKKSIIKAFTDRGCKVTVFPYNTSADKILEVKPDMVMVSSGPGNPEDIPETVATVKELIGKLPICGICAGHLVIGLALGCKIKKLKFGHHGANQPVKCIKCGKVLITSQGHNYVLDELPEGVEMSYMNVNDGTCEGICSKSAMVQSVQFHPEGASGPHDALKIFDDFLA